MKDYLPADTTFVLILNKAFIFYLNICQPNISPNEKNPDVTQDMNLFTSGIAEQRNNTQVTPWRN